MDIASMSDVSRFAATFRLVRLQTKPTTLHNVSLKL